MGLLGTAFPEEFGGGGFGEVGYCFGAGRSYDEVAVQQQHLSVRISQLAQMQFTYWRF
jgi:ABC-type methionine transport system permease subunit